MQTKTTYHIRVNTAMKVSSSMNNGNDTIRTITPNYSNTAREKKKNEKDKHVTC